MSTAPKTELLLSEWVLGLIPPEDVPDLAVAALQGGCGASAVAVLAGLQRPTRSEIDAEPPQLLRELGIVRPTELEALKSLVDDCAASVVGGTVAPAPAAARIAQLWGSGFDPGRSGFDPDRHPAPWIDVVSLIGPAGVGGNRDTDPQADSVVDEPAAAARTLEQARSLLARGGLNIGSRIAAGQLDARVVTACRVQEHILDGAHTALRLGLEFADGLFITFASAPGGAALQLGFRPLRAYDLAEHGRIEVRREGFPCDVLAPGTALRSVAPLVDSADADIGVRIATAGPAVYVSVQGEHLHISRTLPALQHLS